MINRFIFTLLCPLLLSVTPSLAQYTSVERPASMTIFKPFSDIGEGAFTDLPFKVTFYGSVGYDDNVFTSHDRRTGSAFTSLSLDIASHIGNERTRFNADLQLGAIGYWDRPGRTFDPDISLNLTFSHQFTPRLVLGFSSYNTYASQPNFALAVGDLTHSGDYFYSSNTLSLGYQWTRRFSTISSYTFNALYYDDTAVGTTLNRFEHIFGQQFRYQVIPTATAVLEYRFGYVQYLTANADSYSHYVLAGADLTLSPRLTFTFRSGVEFRHQLFGGGRDTTYPYFESTLGYEYQPKSFIQWYNRFGLEQSDITSTAYKKVYRTGLRVQHVFGEKLTLGAALYYSYNWSDQPFSIQEQDIDANVSANYQITRHWGLQAGYTFTRVISDITFRDYYRNRVFIGASYTF
jgi:hypothetical protein